MLVDGTAAARELGFEFPEHHRNLVVLENTPTVHNVIVCTLCSCTAYTIGSKIRVLDGPPLLTGTSVTAEVRVFDDDGANLVRQRHFEFSEGYLARSCPKALSQFSRW